MGPQHTWTLRHVIASVSVLGPGDHLLQCVHKMCRVPNHYVIHTAWLGN